LLFLGAGSVIHAMHGEQDMRNMGGLRKYMSITHITFLLGCLAIAGIPPFSGFFSKDEILAAAYSSSPLLWGVGVVGAMMTAFYMFRLYAMTFLGKFRGTPDQQHHLHESPAAITFPLIILAILAVVGGWIGIPEIFLHGGHRLEAFLEPVFAQSNDITTKHHLSHSTEYFLMGASVIGAAIFIIIAWKRFSVYEPTSQSTTGFGKLLENKWYVDEFYNSIIVKPLRSLGNLFSNVVEKGIIDGVVNGVGRAVNYGSRQIRLLQSGQVGTYVLLMVFGILVLFVIQLFV
jgi:NADH-quinone oxidoreductase subunit L